MYRQSFAIGVAAILVSVNAASAEPVNIATRDAFLAAVGNKELARGKGTFTIIRENGTIVGTLGSADITQSKWEWQDGQFCRSLATASNSYPWTCVRVDIDGDTVIMGGERRWSLN